MLELHFLVTGYGELHLSFHGITKYLSSLISVYERLSTAGVRVLIVYSTMFCTQTWCDSLYRLLIICTKKQFHTVKKFWEEVLPKLQSFYFDAILLELASLYYQQCSIFEPSDRVQIPDIP